MLTVKSGLRTAIFWGTVKIMRPHEHFENPLRF